MSNSTTPDRSLIIDILLRVALKELKVGQELPLDEAKALMFALDKDLLLASSVKKDRYVVRPDGRQLLADHAARCVKALGKLI